MSIKTKCFSLLRFLSSLNEPTAIFYVMPDFHT